ncbi:MAG: hypothetical protein DRZ90_14875, partial [Spirochaetes bacterium]
MSSIERRDKEKNELRTKILEAAKEVLFEKGFDNLTMRAIAERIDYSPTTIYLYFRNKTDLTENLLEYAFEQLVNTIGSIDQSMYAKNPVGLLKEGLITYIRYGVDHPHFYRMMTTSIIEISNNSLTLKEGSMNEKAFAFLESGVQNCVDAGAIEV